MYEALRQNPQALESAIQFLNGDLNGPGSLTIVLHTGSQNSSQDARTGSQNSSHGVLVLKRQGPHTPPKTMPQPPGPRRGSLLTGMYPSASLDPAQGMMNLDFLTMITITFMWIRLH